VKTTILRATAIGCLSASVLSAQERIDNAALNKIRDEGLNRSKVMETASWLTDVYGPRLTNSPTARQAGDWAIKTMQSWGITNPRFEGWDNFGRGWTLERFHMQVTSPVPWMVIGYPQAWAQGTPGVVTGDVVYIPFSPNTPGDSANLKGKVRGKWVMTSQPPAMNPRCTPDASRQTDEQLAALASAPPPNPTGGRAGGGRGANVEAARALAECRGEAFDFAAYVAQLNAAQQNPQNAGGRGGRGGGGGRGGRGGAAPFNLQQFLAREGALGQLTAGGGNSSMGTVFTPNGTSRDSKPPVAASVVTLAPEHYGRIYRILDKGIPVKLEGEIGVRFTADTNSWNVVGEIPGTDPGLKDEVVMLGAHFDSWHAGTGATDNVAGSAVMLEAMRILKTLNLPMKRTVRIGLWTGEEEGLIGSRQYVRKHFGYVDSAGQHFTPEHSKFQAYFNLDNGTGAIRGVYTQGNVEIAPIFRQWLAPFADLGASTVTFNNTGGTDHLSFDAVGLPGFQFIQDGIEYGTRTHHSNMDTFERLVPSDMKRNSVIVASFVYMAANRDQLLPRKATPAGGGRGGN
jgi:hypothetical protein